VSGDRYLIEPSLSLDDLFLVSLLFAYFLVSAELRGRVIVIGIAGAVVLRDAAIAAGLALIETLDAVVYVFGGATEGAIGDVEEQRAGSIRQSDRGERADGLTATA
jgi:Integral membrane protein TerC family